jgi:hypothetical protein
VALIWVEGFSGERALARLWTKYARALAKLQVGILSDDQQGAAYMESQRAKAEYDSVVRDGTYALLQRAKAEQARTHVFIAGVGHYEASGIKPLSTSVHGAHAFAEWMLTRFEKADRPLGSVDLLTSLAPNQNEWTPPLEVANKLGLPTVTTIPAEPATFANLKAAFESWLERAGTFTDNAAVFYFSSHGVWKSEMMLLAQDAQLPGEIKRTDNLIGVNQTVKNMGVIYLTP